MYLLLVTIIMYLFKVTTYYIFVPIPTNVYLNLSFKQSSILDKFQSQKHFYSNIILTKFYVQKLLIIK